MGMSPPQEQTRSSLIYNPKLYLRPSADLTARLTWSGQANLLTAQHSTLLVQAVLRPTRWKLDAFQRHAEARASRSLSRALDTGVRRIPSKAASCRVGQSTNANGWTS